MKVLIVAENLALSPDEVAYSFILNEVIKLSQRGLEVHVVRNAVGKGVTIALNIHYHDVPKWKALDAFFFALSRLGDFSPLLRHPKHLYREARYALLLSKTLQRTIPDVVHAHFAYPEGHVARIALKDKKIPLVLTLHGYDILTEPSINYGIRLSKKYDKIVRRVLNYADKIIVASKAMYEEAIKIASTEKITLIPWGVDLNLFNPHVDGSAVREKHGLENKFVVLFLKHHRLVYGGEYLIRAIPLVLKEKKNVVFVMGGDGPLRSYYEKLARELGVLQYVIFTGYIKRSTVPHYYAASDVVVVPSLQESWGLVVTEALASGKPVIGSNVGGIRDQIIDGYNGFLVPPRDPRAIAEKIIYLAENPEEARRMGLNGRKMAEERFNLEKRIDAILRVYEELL
ncbi:glycosyltransferase [Pyrobaculum sp.]|uniref:glycosyltransferase n=1 Tax=Pyrobaculum sp. TaxID=2004705 RepID=UPI00316A1FB6